MKPIHFLFAAVLAASALPGAASAQRGPDSLGADWRARQDQARGGVQSGQLVPLSRVIEQINDLQTTIASAVEEQTATTNEISRNIAQAATGSGEIAGNITAVANAADSTRAGVDDARAAATALARMSGDLQKLVTQFRY